jgi:hypothetical protein
MDRKILTTKHDLWHKNVSNWEFFIRSYLGGTDYKNGYYLHRYILESPEEYDQRIRHTPLDNHCKNVVQIYTSFLWRVPPTRDYGSLDGDPQLESFIADAEIDALEGNFLDESYLKYPVINEDTIVKNEKGETLLVFLKNKIPANICYDAYKVFRIAALQVTSNRSQAAGPLPPELKIGDKVDGMTVGKISGNTNSYQPAK